MMHGPCLRLRTEKLHRDDAWAEIERLAVRAAQGSSRVTCTPQQFRVLVAATVAPTPADAREGASLGRFGPRGSWAHVPAWEGRARRLSSFVFEGVPRTC